jgi:hypothetical protein
MDVQLSSYRLFRVVGSSTFARWEILVLAILGLKEFVCNYVSKLWCPMMHLKLGRETERCDTSRFNSANNSCVVLLLLSQRWGCTFLPFGRNSNPQSLKPSETHSCQALGERILLHADFGTLTTSKPTNLLHCNNISKMGEPIPMCLRKWWPFATNEES